VSNGEEEGCNGAVPADLQGKDESISGNIYTTSSHQHYSDLQGSNILISRHSCINRLSGSSDRINL
jgi:hypothetical protein